MVGRRTKTVFQVADGRPRLWYIYGGTRTGVELILPELHLRDSDPFPQYPQVGINLSDIHTWWDYPQGRSGPPGGIVVEFKVTITPRPDGSTPMVEFNLVVEPIQIQQP
jgi:hypothetical protein